MSSEPAVSLEVALFFTALAVAIVSWVFARIALDYRKMRRHRDELRDALTPEQFEAWERLNGTLAILRDRARGWATDDFVAAQRVLEALDDFESNALTHPEHLEGYADRARDALRVFDEDPQAARLHHISDALETSLTS